MRTGGGKERMLTMDDIKYIKRMYECEAVSIREIMRRTGYHYETIKKYLEKVDFNEIPKPPKESPSLLDPLKPIIDEWLLEDLKAPRKQRHTAATKKDDSFESPLFGRRILSIYCSLFASDSFMFNK